MKFRIDVSFLLERFGGARGVSAYIARAGIEGYGQRSSRTQKWAERGTIPMQGWLDLYGAAFTLDKVKLDIRDFLVAEDGTVGGGADGN